MFNGDTATYTNALKINTNSTVQEQNGYLKTVRTVTAAGAVTVATSDHVICIDKTVGAATTVNLMSSPATGTEYHHQRLQG